MKSIKFYPNHEDNMHCSQAVFRSLFNYFFDEELTWEEIDKIAKTIPGKAPWTMAEHVELAKRGIEIVNIEPFDYEKFYKNGVDYLKQNFDENTVKYYLEESNLMEVKNDIPDFLRLIKNETRKATIEDIDKFLKENYLVGAEINSRILNKKPGFSLHFVLVRDGNDQNYIINDPGGGSSPPLENRVITKEEFIEALGKEGSNGEVSGFRKKEILDLARMTTRKIASSQLLAMTNMDKQKLLDEITKKIAETRGGPFGLGLNPVPGEGNPNAKVMFIGEAPGFHEDQQGRPFVGVSGQLLRKTMTANGFNERDVFITNIVKFRPPENRDPTPVEIEFFRPFLDEQIEIINPEVIVTVGRFSMYKFLGEGVSISRIHGEPRTVNGKTIFPMFHPAAALRNPPTMHDFIEDFKKLKAFLEKPVDKPTVRPFVDTQGKQLELI